MILSGVFLYILFFSFHALGKKLGDAKPVFLLSLAYALVGTISLAFNPFSVMEASIPDWAKFFSLFLIGLGWFIAGLMFVTGAIIVYYKALTAYYKTRAWFSNKHIHYPVHHPTLSYHPTYSEQTYYPPPPPPHHSRSGSSDELVRKLLEND